MRQEAEWVKGGAITHKNSKKRHFIFKKRIIQEKKDTRNVSGGSSDTKAQISTSCSAAYRRFRCVLSRASTDL